MASETTYYTVNTSDEKFYLCQVQDADKIFKVESIDGVSTIVDADFGDRKFIQLIDPFVVVATPDGPVPVEYSRMPGGSKRLWVNVSNVASFNVIDGNSKLVDALDQMLSQVITAVEPQRNLSRR